jgi:hypothetical protein
MTYHSSLTRIIAYICAVIFLGILLSGGYAVVYFTLIYFGVIDSELHSSGWLLLIIYGSFLYVLRVCYLFQRFMKTLNGKLNYDSLGVTFKLGEISNSYTWKDISLSKGHADCQIFVVFGPNGEHVFTAWELATGYQDFRKAFQENVGT